LCEILAQRFYPFVEFTRGFVDKKMCEVVLPKYKKLNEPQNELPRGQLLILLVDEVSCPLPQAYPPWVEVSSKQQ